MGSAGMVFMRGKEIVGYQGPVEPAVSILCEIQGEAARLEQTVFFKCNRIYLQGPADA
jgi:hypothetical protein